MNTSIRRALFLVAGGLVLTACSSTPDAAPITTPAVPTSTTSAAPTTTTTSTTATTTAVAKPVTAPISSCQASATSAPLPKVDELGSVPKGDELSVRIGGLAANSTLVAGGKFAEFTVTLCNSSPVDYPSIAPAVLAERCTCTTSPIGTPDGTLQQFDPASGTWRNSEHFSIGTGMDYLMVSGGVPMPRGKEITLRYRMAFAKGMTVGTGGITATAVVLPNHVQAGNAKLPLKVAVS